MPAAEAVTAMRAAAAAAVAAMPAPAVGPQGPEAVGMRPVTVAQQRAECRAQNAPQSQGSMIRRGPHCAHGCGMHCKRQVRHHPPILQLLRMSARRKAAHCRLAQAAHRMRTSQPPKWT
jgi:hypothetical protein